MIKLTPKEEKFAKLYIELGNASEAYRQAYGVDENKKDNSVWSNAHALTKKENVSLRIQELQEEAMVVHNVTMESLLNEFDEIKNLAMNAEALGSKLQLGAAVSAVNSKMKLVGLDKTTVDHTSSDGTMSPVMDLDFSKLDDDEIDTLKRLIQKATR